MSGEAIEYYLRDGSRRGPAPGDAFTGSAGGAPCGDLVRISLVIEAGRIADVTFDAYPGRVVTVHSAKSIDEATEAVDVPTVREMIARGMTTLTGDKDPRDSWAGFFDAQDFVGIKINCSGAPGAMSMPDVVAEICRNLITVGVKAENIVIHERGGGQILNAKYPEFVPAGVRVESSNWLGFDPGVYVEANFFGEDDTRSFLLRMATEKATYNGGAFGVALRSVGDGP